MERTLSIVKPDGVERGLVGEVVKRFEGAGIRIAAMKMTRLTLDQARRFYAVHRERPFFDSLTQFMSSGPIVAMILEGENVIQKNRDLMGATNYKDALPGTIRHDYARDIEKNIVHGSDAPETAATEIGFFFNALEEQMIFWKYKEKTHGADDPDTLYYPVAPRIIPWSEQRCWNMSDSALPLSFCWSV